MRSTKRSLWLTLGAIAVLIAAASPGGAADPVYRINAGGPQLLVGSWSVDNNTDPSPYSNFGASGSRAIVPTKDPQGIHPSVPTGTNTNMFRSHRFDPRGGPQMRWDLPLPDGGYEVRLYFSEIADDLTATGQVDAPGERVFDVLLEGAKVIDDLDVFAAAGGPDRGIARSFVIGVTGGLQIDFQREVQNPMISGIEIIPVNASNSPVEAIPSASTLVAKPGSSAVATIQVNNLGGASAPKATIAGASIDGPDAGVFSHDFSGPVTLGGGDSTEVDVTFAAPSTEREFTGTLTIHVAGAPNLLVDLRGISSSTARPSSLSASIGALDFGSVAVDAVASQAFDVTNTGSHIDVVIAGVDVVGADGDEFQATAAAARLGPGESTRITVVFDPDSTGTKSATLRVDHDGQNSPSTLPISARAVSAAGPPEAGFTDIGGSIFQTEINWLAAEGITRGCNPPDNTLFCPKDPVSRGQMAAFLHRALDGILAPGDMPEFVDDDHTVFEADIEWLGATGVTRGCNPPDNDEFCPDDFVTRGQMAAFLHRALEEDLPLIEFPTYVDDNGSVFEADIEWLGATGVTRGCNPPVNDEFCPGDFVTREQMAAFLYRALTES